MKLSDAIIWGDKQKKPNPEVFIDPDGFCGCALGGALLAVGVTPDEYVRIASRAPTGSPFRSYTVYCEVLAAKGLWPWLTEQHVEKISSLYFQVHHGSKTVEDVAAYVRSLEPAEELELVAA